MSNKTDGDFSGMNLRDAATQLAALKRSKALELKRKWREEAEREGVEFGAVMLAKEA